ncbi:MAG: SulP family inorganic anion transporter, partial [Candidatus Gracilibacteria bacterium]|nr:SulP family inorganic anion transporter [Candidatus Gracilibacteria bacterium]
MLLLSYLQKKGLFDEFSDKRQLKTDILSGITVALALIPEAIAFAFVAGVNPIIGLHAAFIVGLITSLFGGRPGMISGATGAMAVVMVAMVQMHGVEYLFATLILTGIFQIAFGTAKLGKIVRLIPHPVMLGFVNGLAIIIFLAQMDQFKLADDTWISGTHAIIMGALIIITMGIMHFLPKLTKSIPSGLVAIVVVTLLVKYLPGLEEAKTVAVYLADNNFADLQGVFPSFHIPQIAIPVWE